MTMMCLGKSINNTRTGYKADGSLSLKSVLLKRVAILSIVLFSLLDTSTSANGVKMFFKRIFCGTSSATNEGTIPKPQKQKSAIRKKDASALIDGNSMDPSNIEKAHRISMAQSTQVMPSRSDRFNSISTADTLTATLLSVREETKVDVGSSSAKKGLSSDSENRTKLTVGKKAEGKRQSSSIIRCSSEKEKKLLLKQQIEQLKEFAKDIKTHRKQILRAAVNDISKQQGYKKTKEELKKEKRERKNLLKQKQMMEFLKEVRKTEARKGAQKRELKAAKTQHTKMMLNLNSLDDY